MAKALPITEVVGTVDTLAHNVQRAWDRCTGQDRTDGARWYPEAHALAADLSPSDVRIGAGVIAALSPQQGWAGNVGLAVRAFTDGHATGHTGDFCRKADRILAGESPLEVLGGQKVRAFYACIVEPEGPWSVCIDRHAFDVAVGRVTDDAVRKVLDRKGAYDHVASAYRLAAVRTNQIPSTLQAITWTAWRRWKGVTGA